MWHVYSYRCKTVDKASKSTETRFQIGEKYTGMHVLGRSSGGGGGSPDFFVLTLICVGIITARRVCYFPEIVSDIFLQLFEICR